jgi:hypothetical protein
MSLFPIIFIILDFEEILTMEQWIESNKAKLYDKVPEKLHFLIEIATILAVKSLNSRIRMLIFTGFLTMLFLNVFTHLGQSIAFQSYSPGVVTAVLVSLPYCVIAYFWLIKSAFINRKDLFISFFLAFLFVPIVPFAHFVGRLLG